mmetsp:Transcript_28950/g.65612  ORF Transcript_28950/g.65612 Transcript_28950/m.65612 type:complete len:86 (-) Transcript_28950:2355-2612(-)
MILMCNSKLEKQKIRNNTEQSPARVEFHVAQIHTKSWQSSLINSQNQAGLHTVLAQQPWYIIISSSMFAMQDRRKAAFARLAPPK